MAIPVATTAIDVMRRDTELGAGEDPWEDTPAEELNAFAVLEEDVRATIEAAGGALAGRSVGPGDSEEVRYTLLCDPCDLQYLDEVKDRSTGQVYRVEWAISSPGVAGMLASVRAGLSTRKGI